MHRHGAPSCRTLLSNVPRRSGTSTPSNARARSSHSSPAPSKPPPTRSSQPLRPHAPPEEFAMIQKLTGNIIDSTSKHGYGWHPTPSFRGQEKRLAHDIKHSQKIMAPSLDKLAFSSSEDIQEESVSNVTFLPGTFVETRRYCDNVTVLMSSYLFIEPQK